MNNARRKRIEKLMEQVDAILDEVTAIKDEEQDAFDNLPESLQYSANGEKMLEAVDVLENAEDDLDSLKGWLESAME